MARKPKPAPRYKRQRIDECIREATLDALIDFANDVDRKQFRDWAVKLIAREPKETSDAPSRVGESDLRELSAKP